MNEAMAALGVTITRISDALAVIYSIATQPHR